MFCFVLQCLLARLTVVNFCTIGIPHTEIHFVNSNVRKSNGHALKIRQTPSFIEKSIRKCKQNFDCDRSLL